MKRFSTLTAAVLIAASLFSQNDPIHLTTSSRPLPHRKVPLTCWEAAEFLRINAPHLTRFVVPLNEIHDTIYIRDTVPPFTTFEGTGTVTTGEWISTDTTNAIYLGDGFWMDTLDGHKWRIQEPDATFEIAEPDPNYVWTQRREGETGWMVFGSGNTSTFVIPADPVERYRVKVQTIQTSPEAIVRTDTVFIHINEKPAQSSTFDLSLRWALVACCLGLGVWGLFTYLKQRRNGHQTDRNV